MLSFVLGCYFIVHCQLSIVLDIFTPKQSATMIIPPYLQPGNTIGIASPASKIDRQDVEPAIELLTNMGYKVEVSPHTFSSFHQYAATDRQRAADFQQLLDNPDIKAIICSRGGYGTLRMLQQLDWSKFRANPKWIVGFSDVTVLHSALNTMQIASIHGVMPRYFLIDGTPSDSFASLMDALNGKPLSYELAHTETNRAGNTTSELTGGNLSMLYSLRGTPLDIDTRGKILFIEDLNEYLYHLDRMMMNLKTGGKLDELSGLIVGSFTGMKDLDTPYGKTVEEIILDSVADYDFPVIFNFPAGHSQPNMALKMGCETRIITTENGIKITQ